MSERRTTPKREARWPKAGRRPSPTSQEAIKTPVHQLEDTEGWLTMGEAHELAKQRGYTKSKSGFQMMATPRNPEKTPPEKLFAEWGLQIDLSRRGGGGQRSRWIRSLPGWE